jgi:EAL domain-containing protein (putative c-di-GMP-specific phosphodiesterase class I)
VELATGRAVGVEALLRWQHPSGALLTADDFLPSLQHSHVITEVTHWVLVSACEAALGWPDWRLSVNVTARDLARPDFVDTVAHVLAGWPLPPEQLTLELTETSLVQDLSRAAMTLQHIRDLGPQIALDDFGTGYSSMLYLRELPITTLKLDRVFVAGIEADGDDLAIVSSSLDLARGIGLTVIAEGVETPGQAERLSQLGCTLGQGYLWSQPRTAPETDAAYANGRLPETPPELALDVPADTRSRAVAMLEDGASLHTIAAALNTAGLHTSRGTSWRAASVARLIQGMPDH